MRGNGRRNQSRFGLAVLSSALLHGAALASFWVSASRAAELPKMRIYSVNIVSPPPQEAGDPAPAVSPPDPAPAQPAPRPEPPKPEPSPPPQPKRETAPKPAEKPKPVPPKETKPAPPKEKPVPKETKPAPKPAVEAKPAPKTSSAPPETKKPAPSRGSNPSVSSAGGEGLNVRIEGVEFSDPAYLENIIRQVNRYFRPPPGSRTDVAEVIFWIARDGSVADIQLGRSSGSFPFRAAAMEAVEQAGLNRAFGPLPKSYPADRLPVAFEFKPAR